MKLEELRKLVAKNSDALQAARANLQEDCAVPLQFSQDYVSRHLPELADFKRLAQAFVAEGRLAEMENRPAMPQNLIWMRFVWDTSPPVAVF